MLRTSCILIITPLLLQSILPRKWKRDGGNLMGLFDATKLPKGKVF